MRVHRTADATLIERGSAASGGVIIVPDHGAHGDIMMRFRPVDDTDGAVLVYDEDAASAEPPLYAAVASQRIDQVTERIIAAIVAAKIPATVKAELRGAIDDARSES